MVNDIDSLDEDFNLDEGLDLGEYEAKEGYRVVPPGAYPVVVEGVNPAVNAKGYRQVYFEYKVTEGEFEGEKFREYFALSGPNAETSKPYLKGRFVSLGCDAEQGKFMPDDVMGVEAVVVRRETTDKNDPTKKYVNVESVKVAVKSAPAKVAAKAAPKKSGGNLLS